MEDIFEEPVLDIDISGIKKTFSVVEYVEETRAQKNLYIWLMSVRLFVNLSICNLNKAKKFPLKDRLSDMFLIRTGEKDHIMAGQSTFLTEALSFKLHLCWLLE